MTAFPSKMQAICTATRRSAHAWPGVVNTPDRPLLARTIPHPIIPASTCATPAHRKLDAFPASWPATVQHSRSASPLGGRQCELTGRAGRASRPLGRDSGPSAVAASGPGALAAQVTAGPAVAGGADCGTRQHAGGSAKWLVPCVDDAGQGYQMGLSRDAWCVQTCSAGGHSSVQGLCRQARYL